MMKNTFFSLLAGMCVLSAPAYAADENVKLTVGQSHTVTLPGNPTTGYLWSVAEAPDAVTVTLDMEEVKAPRGMVGCPLATVVTIKAVKAGQGEVKLVYARPWEKGKAPAETHTIQVTVK